MRYLAAIFLFGVALVALGGSFAGMSSRRAQVQFVTQPVRIVNTPADGGYIPVANEREHPLFVTTTTPAPPQANGYEYKVEAFSPPLQTGSQDPQPKVDIAKLPGSLEAALNAHQDWEIVNVPATFSPGVNLLVFRRRK